MWARAVFLAASVGLAAPASASDVLSDPMSAGRLVAQACISPSLDFDALFIGANALVSASGLPVAVQNAEVGMWGDPGGAHLIVSRTIDSLACQLKMPSPDGSETYFEALRDSTEAEIKAVYETALSDAMDKPSPHEAAHQWVMRVPAKRHFAASLDWQREQGVMLGIGYSQIYE